MELSVLYFGRLMIRSMVGLGKELTMLALYGITGDFQVRGGFGRVRDVVASTG